MGGFNFAIERHCGVALRCESPFNRFHDCQVGVCCWWDSWRLVLYVNVIQGDGGWIYVLGG